MVRFVCSLSNLFFVLYGATIAAVVAPIFFELSPEFPLDCEKMTGFWRENFCVLRQANNHDYWREASAKIYRQNPVSYRKRSTRK